MNMYMIVNFHKIHYMTIEVIYVMKGNGSNV